MRAFPQLLAALALAAATTAVQAQAYPSKPIRLVVPFPPGGPTDLIARVMAAGMAIELGQQVIIDNKGGAGGNVGTELVAKSKPDGYTLLFGTAATHGINVSLYKSLPYDPVKDFEAIALVGLAPMALLDISEVTGDQRWANAAISGLAWSRGNNELHTDLLDIEGRFAHRSIRRRPPLDRLLLATNAVTARTVGRPLVRRAILVEVNRTCRPYHLGWILEAWAGRSNIAAALGG